MTSGQIFTIYILLGLGLLALAYDFVQAARGEWSDTVSCSVHTICVGNPIIPFLLGLVIGHVIWPIARDVKPPPAVTSRSPTSPAP